MKPFSQEHAQRMYNMLKSLDSMIDGEVLVHRDGSRAHHEGIDELLAEIDNERKVSERKINSTFLTTAEYAAIHAINKRFKG